MALVLFAGSARGARAEDAPSKEKRAPADAPRDAEQTEDERYPIEFRRRVGKSIDRGVAWLRTQQAPDGSFPSHYGKHYPMGPTALATLTLLKGGVKPDDAAIKRAFAHLRTLPMQKVYSVAVLLMALDARHAPARDPFVAETVDRYGRATRKDPCLDSISKEDAAWMKVGVSFLIKHQTTKGVWRYPTKDTFDLSNTQYALLGLKAAMRCGMKIPPSVWLSALRFLIAHQRPDGKAVRYQANEVRGKYRIAWSEPAKARGFQYANAKQPITGSMTTAGLSSLIICQSELWGSRQFKGDLRNKTRLGIRDAMAWLQTWMEVRVNPVEGLDGKPAHPPAPAIGGPNHYYYLYGLERASILGRIRLYGKRDWYEEGAEILMMDQREDGSWPCQMKLTDSCFALLFLKRATIRMKVPVITPEARPPKSKGSKR
jgi:hypothetical protein